MTIRRAITQTRAFLRGMQEYRQSITTSSASYRMRDTYDRGRDLAHRLTFRRYDY